MKSQLILISLLFIHFNGICSNFNLSDTTIRISAEEVPDNIYSAFGNKYPEIAYDSIQWSKNKTFYIADFVNVGKKTKAYYNQLGEWVRSVTELPLKELPLRINKYLRRHYPTSPVIRSVLLEDEKGISYEVLLKRKNENQQLSFSQQGKYLKPLVRSNH